MEPKVVTGARAKVFVTIDGKPTLVGIFSSFSYQVALGVQGAWILGRHSAASTEYTDYELVNGNAAGFRVVDAGPHTVAGIPKLQDLLLYENTSFQVFDRKTNKVIGTIEEVKPTGFGTGVAAKQLSEFNMSFSGLIMSDESGPQAESPGAADLP